MSSEEKAPLERDENGYLIDHPGLKPPQKGEVRNRWGRAGKPENRKAGALEPLDILNLASSRNPMEFLMAVVAGDIEYLKNCGVHIDEEIGLEISLKEKLKAAELCIPYFYQKLPPKVIEEDKTEDPEKINPLAGKTIFVLPANGRESQASQEEIAELLKHPDVQKIVAVDLPDKEPIASVPSPDEDED